MNTVAERLEELLDLLHEVDVATLHAVERTLHQLLEQKGAEQPRTEPTQSARDEFGQRYPQSMIDPDLWALVGSQPANPVEDDKVLIREQIGRRLAQ